MQAKTKITSTVKILLLSFIAYLGIAQGVQAATMVSGAITANTTWTLAQSPYQVTSDITVDNGATLAIEAGVVVYLDAARNLTINNGALNARGTAGQPIIFTSTLDTAGSIAAPGNWGQIRFLNGSNDAATLIEHAQIRYGQGISIQSASPTLNHLQLTNNLGSAISIDLNSSPKGVGNQASGNTLNGISVPAGDVTGSVTWGVKGIPYVVASGVVSVGSTPALSTLNIGEIQQGETINAMLSGSRLSGAQGVAISSTGITATVLSGATDTSVPVQLIASPDATLGATDIALQVAAGRPVLAGALQVVQPQPTVNSIGPNSLYAGQAGIALSVTGKNFVPESVIRVDGTDLTTVYASAASLSTTLPVLTAGNKSITVKQPDPLLSGGFLISKPAALSVTVPQLSISPVSASRILGDPLSLTVTSPFAAPVGGMLVDLASSAASIATVPASVTIAEGASSAAVPVTTAGLGVASITASRTGFVSASSQLEVLAPPTLAITTVKQVDVVGSNFSLSINANRVAGAGGLVVDLASSDVAVATVPSSVTIPEGGKTVNLQVAAVATGIATITATSSGYIAGISTLTVRPFAQSASVAPLPVAIPPDNVARKVTLKLATVDAIDHVYSVSVANTAVATAGVTSITIPAGQTSALLPVTGKKEGTTTINLASSTLDSIAIPVYVTVEYAGINMNYSPMVGVVFGTAAAPPPANLNVLQPSPMVGVVFGEAAVPPPANLNVLQPSPMVGVVFGEAAAPPAANLNVLQPSPMVGVVFGEAAAPPPANLNVLQPSPLVGVVR